MAVEKAGTGESDTSEFVTGPFSVTFNVRIRIRLPYPRIKPGVHFLPLAMSRTTSIKCLTSADGWNTVTTLSSRGSIGHVSFGERRPFLHVPYFFPDVFDLSYELWGDSEGATETIVRGDLGSSSFSVWWLKRN